MKPNQTKTDKTDISSPSSETSERCKDHTASTPETVLDDDEISPLQKKYRLMDIKPDHVDNGVPVFKPTWNEFKDFYLFQKSINKYGMQSGIVKVIPPAEWFSKEMAESYPVDVISQVHFKSPIAQEFTNHHSCFSINNIEKKKTFNLLQWKRLSYQQNYLIPPMKGESNPTYNKPTERDAEKFKHVKGNTNVVAEDAFEDFDYNIDTSIYTNDRCEFLENQYWKTISFSTPLYGADSLGSLFTEDQHVWNVAKLPNLLDWLPEKLPGVNDAYLYGGLWKASFSWHLEDQDLYSINYIHFGAPKQWYSISQKDHMKFYHLMSEIFPDDYINCSEFLRHKTFAASPAFLARHGIEVNKIIHREKEFIITYPYGYHSGFNYGYNLAESVNFALDDWLDIGLASKRCMCIEDSVGINVQKLIKRLNGDFSESDQEEYDVVPELSPESAHDDDNSIAVAKPKSKKHPTSTKPPKQQCLLCPSSLPSQFLHSYWFELLDVYSGDQSTAKLGRCHRLCGRLIAGLRIERISVESNPSNGADTPAKMDVVFDFKELPKARKALKCTSRSCNSVTDGTLKGVCFQCSHSKCTRAYHPTCGVAAGVLLSENDDGEIIGLCRFHRPVKLDPDEVHESKSALVADTVVQFRLGEGFHAGRVITNNCSEGSISIAVQGEVLDVPYEDILPEPESRLHISLSQKPVNVSQSEILKKLELQRKQAEDQVKKAAEVESKRIEREKQKQVELAARLEKQRQKEIQRLERIRQKEEERAQRKLEKQMQRLEKRKRNGYQDLLPTYHDYHGSVRNYKDVYNYELEYFCAGSGTYQSYQDELGQLHPSNFVEVITLEELDALSAQVNSSSFYYYLPEISNEMNSRFTNDISRDTPNDPEYLRILEKAEIEKVRAVRREQRRKRKAEEQELEKKLKQTKGSHVISIYELPPAPVQFFPTQPAQAPFIQPQLAHPYFEAPPDYNIRAMSAQAPYPGIFQNVNPNNRL